MRIIYIKDDVLSLKKFKLGFDFGNIDKKNVLGTVNKIIFTTAEWSRRILVKELMEEINEIISNCLSYHYVNHSTCVFFNGNIFFKTGTCELPLLMYFNGKVGWVSFKIIQCTCINEKT